MKLSTLRRKVRRQAGRELLKGKLSFKDFTSVVKVAGNNEALLELNDRMLSKQIYQNRYSGVGVGGFLANFWDWFYAHWPEILNMILTIAPLFAEDYDEEN